MFLSFAAMPLALLDPEAGNGKLAAETEKTQEKKQNTLEGKIKCVPGFCMGGVGGVKTETNDC